MAKTYNTISSVSTGDVYTATQHNSIVTNVNNYRVPPMCRITKSGTTRPFSSSTSAIAMDNGTTNGYDTDGMYSAAANTRITIKTAGIYVVTASAYTAWEAGTWTTGTFALQKSGVTIASDESYGSQAAIAYRTYRIAWTGALAVDEYLTVYHTFAGASTMNLYGDSTFVGTTHIAATWVGQVS